MVDVNEGGETTEVVSSDSSSVDNGTPVATEGEASGGVAEGSENVGAEEAQKEGEVNASGDKKHEEAIPYERFKEVNDKLTSVMEMFESAKDNPEVRQQLAEQFGLTPAQPVREPEPELSPFERTLQESVDPTAQPHYRAMFKAFAQEQEAFIDKMLEPFKAYVGESRIKEVEQKNPDFKKYQGDVVKLMRKHHSLDPEEALILAAHKDRQKLSVQAGKVNEQKRQAAINKAPITKKQGSIGGTPDQSPKSIREAVTRNWERMEQQA